MIVIAKRDPSSLFTQHPCGSRWGSVHQHRLLTNMAQPWRRYISVALFLKSPSAGVTRYPCPVEPGLSSRPAFRPGRATVCLTRLSILAESDGIVNAWPQCGLHIGGSRQGLPLKIPDGLQTQLGPGFMAPQPREKKSGKERGVVVFFSDLRYNFLVCQSLPPSAALGAYP